jgi:hypothetical protein
MLLDWVGRLEHAEGREDAARAAWRRAARSADELARTDPERVEWRQLLGVARLHVALGRAGQAPHAARKELLRALARLDLPVAGAGGRSDDPETSGSPRE